MSYYFSRILNTSFEEGAQKVTEALKAEGLGVISEINIHEKFREKLGVDFKRYRILGACSPAHAYKALLAEDKIGTMLPCNVLVIEQGEGRTEISAVNPVASMMGVHNPELEPVAVEITEKLKRVIDKL